MCAGARGYKQVHFTQSIITKLLAQYDAAICFGDDVVIIITGHLHMSALRHLIFTDTYAVEI